MWSGDVSSGEGLESISPAGPTVAERATALQRFGGSNKDPCSGDMWSAIDVLYRAMFGDLLLLPLFLVCDKNRSKLMAECLLLRASSASSSDTMLE